MSPEQFATLLETEKVLLETNLDLIRINSEKEAHEKLQTLSLALEEYLFIIDPYLYDFIYFNDLIAHNNSVKDIKIIFHDIDSWESLKKEDPDVSLHGFKDYIREYIYKNIYDRDVIMKTLNAKQGKGFHDRFIFTKSRCWSIGSSLNKLGNKMSYIIDVDYSTLKYDRTLIVRKSDILLKTFNNLWANIQNEYINTKKDKES